jgi:hypothetical protein
MGSSGAKDRGKVRSWCPLLLALPLLAGCSSLNDQLVRIWFEDRELGNRVKSQIWEGLERRQVAPEHVRPKRAAPAFLDQG